MTYISHVAASSGQPLDAIWRSVSAFGARILCAIMTAQERRAQAFLDLYRRDRFCR